MKLFDTMIIVYARASDSPFHQWAKEQIALAVVTEGAAINAVTLAELCSENGAMSESVIKHINAIGIHILDVPATAAARCGEAYRKYRQKRKRESGKDSPKIPLPDFFIGAQAEIMNWELVTNDAQRFQNFFPKMKLVLPTE
jgi:predicted nucleic acid-binding protein